MRETSYSRRQAISISAKSLFWHVIIVLFQQGELSIGLRGEVSRDPVMQAIHTKTTMPFYVWLLRFS